MVVGLVKVMRVSSSLFLLTRGRVGLVCVLVRSLHAFNTGYGYNFFVLWCGAMLVLMMGLSTSLFTLVTDVLVMAAWAVLYVAAFTA